MKRSIILIFLFLQVFVYAQTNNYLIKGKVGNYNAPAIIYLNHIQSGIKIKDSVLLKNGEFEFPLKLLSNFIIMAGRLFPKQILQSICHFILNREQLRLQPWIL